MSSIEDCEAGRPTIAVIGFSARAAAQSAKRQGFEVVAIDLCADRDLLEDCIAHYRLDDPSWPDILNSNHPTTSLLLTGGMEHRTDCVDRCHFHSQRFGASGIQLQSMRTLANWERWAVSSGLSWPTTFTAAEFEFQPMFSVGHSEWLVKLFQSGGGIGTIDFDLRELPLNRESVYIQKRMAGETIGVTFLSSLVGSTFIGATAACPPESAATDKRYVYRGSYGPIPLSKSNIDNLQRFAAIAGRESGLLGVWQADFLLLDGELTLLEINPRWSASMDILDVGLDLRLVQKHDSSVRGTLSAGALNQLALDALEKSMSSPERMIGKLVVYADQRWFVTQAQSDLWWSSRWSMDMLSELNHCWFADIPTAGARISPGGPILSIMATGSTKESILIALEAARKAVLTSSVSHLSSSINR
jgi:uncharacterized protein